MMKKLSFIPLVCVAFIFGFTGCLDTDDTDNYQVFSEVLTVVGHNQEIDVPTFRFYRGEVTAEILATAYPQYQEEGTTLRTEFKIDYNNQSGKYYKANELYTVEAIPQQTFREDETFSPTQTIIEGMLPLNSVRYYCYANQLGRMFLETRLDSVSKANLNYNLVYVPFEETEDGQEPVLDFYVYADQAGDDIIRKTETATHAFNLKELYKTVKDTTDRYSNVDYKRLYINLYYYTGENNRGEPQWSLLNTSANNPIELLMYREDLR